MSSCLSGFPSMCCFGLFGDAYLSRYLRIVCTFRTDKQHEWRCDSCSLKSMQVLAVEVDSSREWLLACTEALCMSWMGGSSPILVPRDL